MPYIGTQLPVPEEVQDRKSFTAVGGETVFSVSFQHEDVDVYLNGVHLQLDVDYTLDSTANTVTLTSQANANDVIDLVGYTALTNNGTKWQVLNHIIGTTTNENTSFAVDGLEVDSQEMVYVNGILQYPGGSNDYTVTSNVITFTSALLNNDTLSIHYIKPAISSANGVTFGDLRSGNSKIPYFSNSSSIIEDVGVPVGTNAMMVGPIDFTTRTVLTAGTVNTSSNYITLNDGISDIIHGLVRGNKIQFETNAPSPASVLTDYWVTSVDTKYRFKISSTDFTDGVTAESIVAVTGTANPSTVKFYPALRVDGNLTIV